MDSIPLEWKILADELGCLSMLAFPLLIPRTHVPWAVLLLGSKSRGVYSDQRLQRRLRVYSMQLAVLLQPDTMASLQSSCTMVSHLADSSCLRTLLLKALHPLLWSNRHSASCPGTFVGGMLFKMLPPETSSSSGPDPLEAGGVASSKHSELTRSSSGPWSTAPAFLVHRRQMRHGKPVPEAKETGEAKGGLLAAGWENPVRLTEGQPADTAASGLALAELRVHYVDLAAPQESMTGWLLQRAAKDSSVSHLLDSSCEQVLQDVAPLLEGNTHPDPKFLVLPITSMRPAQTAKDWAAFLVLGVKDAYGGEWQCFLSGPGQIVCAYLASRFAGSLAGQVAALTARPQRFLAEGAGVVWSRPAKMPYDGSLAADLGDGTASTVAESENGGPAGSQQSSTVDMQDREDAPLDPGTKPALNGMATGHSLGHLHGTASDPTRLWQLTSGNVQEPGPVVRSGRAAPPLASPGEQRAGPMDSHVAHVSGFYTSKNHASLTADMQLQATSQAQRSRPAMHSAQAAGLQAGPPTGKPSGARLPLTSNAQSLRSSSGRGLGGAKGAELLRSVATLLELEVLAPSCVFEEVKEVLATANTLQVQEESGAGAGAAAGAGAGAVAAGAPMSPTLSPGSKSAPAVPQQQMPARASLASIGGHTTSGSDPENASRPLPFAVVLPDVLSQDQVLQRFVGPDLLASLPTHCEENEEWLDKPQTATVINLKPNEWVCEMSLPRSAQGGSGVRLFHSLGKGMYSEVHACVLAGRRYALKMVNGDLNPGLQESLQRYVESTRRCQEEEHPGWVRMHYCGAGRRAIKSISPGLKDEAKKSSHLDMNNTHAVLLLDYCDRGSLKQSLAKGPANLGCHPTSGGNPPPVGAAGTGPDCPACNLPLVLYIALEVARTLERCHRHNLIHGNLKPSSVLLQLSYTAPWHLAIKIGGFGFSLRLQQELEGKQLPAARINTGAITHTAPEVLLKSMPPTRASDVYSYGILLWELMSGQQACTGSLPLLSIAYKMPTEQLRPAVPASWDSSYVHLMTACWQATPERRPQLAEVVGRLEEMAGKQLAGNALWAHRPRPSQLSELSNGSGHAGHAGHAVSLAECSTLPASDTTAGGAPADAEEPCPGQEEHDGRTASEVELVLAAAATVALVPEPLETSAGQLADATAAGGAGGPTS